MKRTPLKRKTPMRRTRLQQKPPRKRSSAEGGDEVYLDWIRSLPCCVCGVRTSSHAHHSTGAGMALKAPDREAMPLCPRCHRDFHDGKGFSDGWRREQRALWQELQVERCQRLYSTISDLPQSS